MPPTPVEQLNASPPSEPAGPRISIPKKAPPRVKVADRLAAAIIRLGGAAVIVAVLGIFVFLVHEIWPLLLSAKSKVTYQGAWPVPEQAGEPLVIGIDEYETYVYGLFPGKDTLQFVDAGTWQAFTNRALPKLGDREVVSAYRTPAGDHLFIGTSDGYVLLVDVKFRPVYDTGERQIVVSLSEGELIEVCPEGTAVEKVFGLTDGGTAHFAAACGKGKLYTGRYEEGEGPRIEEVGGEVEGNVTHLLLDEDGDKLFAATDEGLVYHWYLEENRETPFSTLRPGGNQKRISALEFVIGHSSILIGYDDGSIEQWFGVRESPDQFLRPYQKIRSFEPLPGPVTQIARSGRDRGFVAASSDGTVRLYFSTSGRTLLTLNAGGPLAALCYAPKLTSIVAATAENRAAQWAVENPHPEVSWRTLFAKVWYEGHDEPKFEWQSTGGSDDFESKLSLVPLTLGTLKGAFYGLLFAIPIAVLAALYTSQFMHHRIRTMVKPTVEIMAALPSVVIGFLAGLWLAPILENHVISFAAVLVAVPALVLLAVAIWHRLPIGWRLRVPHGTELALIVPIVVLGFIIALNGGPWLEFLFFKGNFKQWVFDTFGQQFEQRNSIVIGFAMGFAVIPIIFTISEDALSNVPQHFVSGSLALGASRWQTATRVILPTASPGIFSAVMVGFGRAVGETMIVLMATGNTPILSFSPFNGMRTLSANIAVEIPEAPVAGTLYRILFLTAILLFVMTFIVNTVAEVIRQRLREKYQAV